ncbi:MAG TPA: hypothetical protein VEP90_04260 [Methylomirabilota bacterium]|nr:hypothetical protein [Methylomirabilota bacterium]
MNQVLVLPNSTDTIVLYDPDSTLLEHGQLNLFRLDKFGKVIWAAELPPYSTTKIKGDMYVAAGLIQMAHIEKGTTVHLHANSFSCCYVEIDVSTGKITNTEFTK